LRVAHRKPAARRPQARAGCGAAGVSNLARCTPSGAALRRDAAPERAPGRAGAGAAPRRGAPL